MSRDITPLKEQLFRMLSSKGYQPKIVDTSNKEVQVPEEADLIRFIFTKDGKKYGPVDLTIEGNSIVIYLSDGVLSSPDFPSPGAGYDDSWNGLRNHIRSWGHRFGLVLSIKNQNHLQPDMAKRHHMKTNKIAEGYYPMGKQASYNDSVPNVKIVIQHTRKIEEGEQRFRNVEKIFIENTVGERILAPTLRPGVARIYARHIAEGGLPHDDRWKHLSSLVEEYTKMAGFVRATRAGQFNESAQKLVNEGINHYLSLRESLGKMTGHRGYNAYFEAWSPALMEEQIEEANLNELFVQETLDPRIENVLPILSKLHKKVNEMSEVTELAEWADRLIGEDESLTSNNPVAIPEQDMAEDTEQLSLEQLATISDEALDNAYHYGRSSPGNTFGWQANLKSAAFAKQMIDKGVTDIEAISDAIHKGWNVTAKAFVQNPDQFADTEKLKAAGKLEAKLQQREKLMNIGYTQLPDDEQEKDRVVARALLQAIKGNQGVAESQLDEGAVDKLKELYQSLVSKVRTITNFKQYYDAAKLKQQEVVDAIKTSKNAEELKQKIAAIAGPAPVMEKFDPPPATASVAALAVGLFETWAAQVVGVYSQMAVGTGADIVGGLMFGVLGQVGCIGLALYYVIKANQLGKRNQDVAEAKADPLGAWIAHKNGTEARKFKTREGAKKYVASHEGFTVSSSEAFHDTYRKKDAIKGQQGVAEATGTTMDASQALQAMKQLANTTNRHISTRTYYGLLDWDDGNLAEIVVNAIKACSAFIDHFRNNKQLDYVQTLKKLQSELIAFKNGDAFVTIKQLSQGTLSKINFQQGVAEGKSDYKIKSIGTDAKGDYYISPSTGKKVYKSGVKKGDHENPKTGEHKGVNEERIETKDKEGNVIGWEDGTDWKKSKGKDPRGKVTNLSDKARRETEKAEKEKVKEGNDDLARILTIMNHRR